MKRIISVALATLFVLTTPVVGFCGVTAPKYTKIYNSEKYQSADISYSTGSAKVYKKGSDGKEYLKVEINYPVLNGYSEAVKEYNAKNKENARKMLNDFVAKYTKEAKKYYASAKKTSTTKVTPYSLKVEYSMKFNEDNIISVLYTTKQFNGAEEKMFMSSENIDLLANKQLALDDASLFPKKGETMAYAINAFKKTLKLNKNIYYQDVNITADDINYYIEGKSIVFYINPGVIAPEDRGVVTYTLLDDVARKYLNAKVR